jgi:hypothetical protein
MGGLMQPTQLRIPSLCILLSLGACQGETAPPPAASAAPKASTSAAASAAAKPSESASATAPAADTAPAMLTESPVSCTWTKGLTKRDDGDEHPEFECKNTSDKELKFVQFVVHYYDGEKQLQNSFPHGESATPVLFKAGETKKLGLGLAKKYLKPEYVMMRVVGTNGSYVGEQKWSVPALEKDRFPKWVD